jgi:hypothetical protein
MRDLAITLVVCPLLAIPLSGLFPPWSGAWWCACIAAGLLASVIGKVFGAES